MKHFLGSLFILFFIFIPHVTTYSVEDGSEWIIEEVSSELDENTYEIFIDEYDFSLPLSLQLGSEINIDITDFDTELQSFLQEWESWYTYIWDIFNEWSFPGTSLNLSFDSYGEKNISLGIYQTWEESEEILVARRDFSLFVYKDSLPVLISTEIESTELILFEENAKNVWTYIYKIWVISEEDINIEDISTLFVEYSELFSNSSDYLVVWWEKEFLLSALSKISREESDNKVQNFVLVSSYNGQILQNFLWNSLAWKDFINTAFIIDDSIINRLFQNATNINTLEADLLQNEYNFLSISERMSISPYYFISSFISSLSDNGVTTSQLYIILLLPIFLTVVAVSKHLIWISPVGTIIPVFIAILYIQIWIFFTTFLLLFIVCINILLSSLVSRYTLLYTPKVTFLTIINFIIFIIFFNFAYSQGFIEISSESILYVVLFFIVAERLITLITSKELREYKKSLYWTLLVSIFCVLLYNIDFFLIFLTAYPETLIILIPFNFFLWRFTGLRVSEYFRFREVYKNIEE